MISSLIGWAVFGLIVGAIARFLVPGPDPLGCFGTLAIGVAGSILGGWLGDFFFRAHEGPFQPAGLIGSLMGAVLLLLLVRQFRKPSERS